MQDDEAPPDLVLDPTISGPVPLEFLEGELAQPGRVWPPSGFVDAYQHAFLFPGDPHEAPPPPDEVQAVISLLILFETPEDATAFLEEAFPPDFQIDAPEFEALGDDRRALITEPTPKRPERSTILWRRGNPYLQLNAFGDFSQETVLEWAEAMDARAS